MAESAPAPRPLPLLQPQSQPHNPAALTSRLLAALDTSYNVVDMRAIDEVISVLENINITKELLETTRLGKHVNELRRRTGDAALARRTKLLVKRWRDLVIPDKAGSKPAARPASAESTPRRSPLAVRGISPTVTPSVTPRLSSPRVTVQGSSVHKQQSCLTPPDGVRSLQHHIKRQPLTSPALHNLSPSLKNSSHALLRNSSQNFKNAVSRNSSPAQRNVSPGVKNVSPAVRNSSPNTKGPHQLGGLVSPALRLPPDTTVWSSTISKDPYDSDSQDVIFVDNNIEDVKTNASNIKNANKPQQNDKCSKRPRSPINGGPETTLPSDELRRDAKRARRETSSRKAKKRRNHTKSENRTVDHSSDPVSVGSPFLPISSASTSPALSLSGSLRNGINNTPIGSVVSDDLDSRSMSSIADSKLKSLQRKNGCKKPPEVDGYSNFIKSRIPTGGRKVKTTKELLEEMQARKSGKIAPTSLLDKRSTKPKEDFLTTYDTQKQLKKEVPLVTDIIELNDSNSSSKIIESAPQSPSSVKRETLDLKVSDEEKPTKFESVEVIMSRLPPIDYSWRDHEEDFSPTCTCIVSYADSEVEKDEKTSIFDDANVEMLSIMPIEKIDHCCRAAKMYQRRPAEVADCHVDALHNDYIADVNGSTCTVTGDKKKAKLACRINVWGLRPYYDCSRDLFHNVVPKYNYLDSSLDKCVKNLSDLVLDRYEPADVSSSTDDWFLSLENEHFTKWDVQNENINTDEFESAADSPFSEINCDDDRNTDDITPAVHVDSDKKISDSDNNIDRDNDINAPEKKPKENSDGNKTSCFEVLDYEVTIPYRSFSTMYSKCVFLDDVDFVDGPDECSPEPDHISVHSEINDEEDNYSEDNYESFVPRLVKKFTYEDSITLLPLSLPAINAFVSYDNPGSMSGDLSCIFRSNKYEEQSPKETCDLSYSLVKTARVMEMKDVASSVLSRTRDLCVEGLNEDANCESDIKQIDELTNSGAFVNNSNVEEENCVKNGCPSWIPSSVPPNSFSEWHEPVLRTSYNEEPLTILPYVVID